jgi:eukaryotic-like serine/threonine-protein kinase
VEPGDVEPQRLGSTYELLERIARGGTAEIFLARRVGEAGFEKRLVIKRVLPQLSEDRAFIEVFLQEARLGAQLSHPNIVQIFDVGRGEDQVFIAMEYVDGRSLLELVVEARRAGVPLPLPVLVKIASQVAEGLHLAHNATDADHHPLAIVHRDVSPSNVLISFSGLVKVTDFGIAKASWAAHTTRAGVVRGKYSYMSPQQCLGHPVDHRTDLFSLGVVLFEITTLRRLFARRSEPETIAALLSGPIPAPSSIIPGYPPVLEEIVMHCLRRDPEERYQTAWSLHTDLERYLRESEQRCTATDVADVMQQIYPAESRRIVHRPVMVSDTFYEMLSPTDELAMSHLGLPSRGDALLSRGEKAALIASLLAGSGSIWLATLWALSK